VLLLYLCTVSWHILLGAIVFLPLLSSPIVFLLFVFQFCDFTPVILKQRSSLSLSRYVMLTVLNMIKKQNCPCDFTSNMTLSL
jgi:hypothetical protein